MRRFASALVTLLFLAGPTAAFHADHPVVYEATLTGTPWVAVYVPPGITWIEAELRPIPLAPIDHLEAISILHQENGSWAGAIYGWGGFERATLHASAGGPPMRLETPSPLEGAQWTGWGLGCEGCTPTTRGYHMVLLVSASSTEWRLTLRSPDAVRPLVSWGGDTLHAHASDFDSRAAVGAHALGEGAGIHVDARRALQADDALIGFFLPTGATAWAAPALHASTPVRAEACPCFWLDAHPDSAWRGTTTFHLDGAGGGDARLLAADVALAWPAH